MLRERLLPLVDWVTPNIDELGILTGRRVTERGDAAGGGASASGGRGRAECSGYGRSSEAAGRFSADGGGRDVVAARERGSIRPRPMEQDVRFRAHFCAVWCRERVPYEAAVGAKLYVAEAIRTAAGIGQGTRAAESSLAAGAVLGAAPAIVAGKGESSVAVTPGCRESSYNFELPMTSSLKGTFSMRLVHGSTLASCSCSSRPCVCGCTGAGGHFPLVAWRRHLGSRAGRERSMPMRRRPDRRSRTPKLSEEGKRAARDDRPGGDVLESCRTRQQGTTR